MSEDPSFTLAQKTQQNHRVKVKGGEDEEAFGHWWAWWWRWSWRAGRSVKPWRMPPDGRAHSSDGAVAGVLQASILARRQAARQPTGTVPYIIDVNAASLFSDYALSLLVRARMIGGEQMGARALFAAIPREGSRRMTRTGRCSISSMAGVREEEGATRMGRGRLRSHPVRDTSSNPTPRRPHNSPTPRAAMAHRNNNIGPPESSIRRGEEGEEEEDGDDDDLDDTTGDPKKGR